MSCYTTPRLKCAALVTLIVWVAGVLPTFSQTRQIVLLYDERTDLPGLAKLDAGIVRGLTSELPDSVEIYREAMDLSRFDSDAYRSLLRNYLRAKYATKKIDVAVAVMEPALDFLLNHRDEVFPGAPIVFCGIDRRRLGGRPLPLDVTGVLLKREFSPTLELVLSLHPGTDRIVVVAGTSEFDARLLDQAREEFRPFQDRLTLTYLTVPPLPELLSQLSQLPPKTIVLYSTVFRDGAGKPCVPYEVAERVSAAANAPVYGFFDQFLGHGIVGGQLYSLSSHGEAAARMVTKIMAGTKPSELPLIEPVNLVTAFDWQQLQRWGIDESRLPSGAIIRLRPASFWSDYKYYVIGGLLVIMAQTASIAGLVAYRARRRSAEAAVRESEERLKLAAEAADFGVWMWTLATNRVWGSERAFRLFGFEPDADVSYEMVARRTHPDDRERVASAVRQAIKNGVAYASEYRILLPDGTVRWVATQGRVYPGADGKPARLLGAAVDITARKQSELEITQQRNQLTHLSRVTMLGELSGSLAHELNQPLTAILSNAQAAQRFLARDNIDLDELRHILKDIVDDDKRAGEVIRRLRLLLKKGEVRQQPLDVNAAVQEILKLVRSDLVIHGVTAQAELAPGLPMIHADPVQFQQVMLNLVINACDAMRGNTASDRQLFVRTERVESSGVRVSISDRGCGIPADKIGRIFEPFFTTKAHGMGLGLSVCRTIIEAHRGRIWVENNSSGGATFRVTLPVAAEAAKSRMPPGQAFPS